jgi:hypothetical protein
MLTSGVDVIEATWRPRCRPRADMAPRGMQRLSSSFALVVVLVVPTWSALGGCAARFQGELDGDLVPSFSSAAFALRAGTGTTATVTGFAVQGDSCAEALTFTGLQQRSLEATSEDRRDQTATAQADWFNRVVPDGQWLMSVVLRADRPTFLKDAKVDVDNLDTDVAVQMSLCRSDGLAEARDGAFEPKLDCYLATDGPLQIALDDEAETLRLLADSRPLEFGQNGQDQGDLLVDVSLGACDGFADALDELQAVGGKLVVGEGEGEGEPVPGACSEECFAQPTGEVVCRTVCR